MKDNKVFNKNILKRIIVFTFLLLSIFVFLNTTVFAGASSIAGSVEDPSKSDPSKYINVKAINTFLSVIKAVSIGVAVILITIDGIKYLTEPDAEKKAFLQQKIFYYLIGGVLIFGAVQILQLFSKFSQELSVK